MKGSFLLLLLFSTSVMALEHDGVSAYRPFHVDYSFYEQKELNKESDQKILRITPLRSATLYSENNLPDVTAWKSKTVMQERFEALRDERFITLSSNPDFPRRISWLYPKDGCFARAALLNRNAFRKYIPIPKKIFAFGNLRVKTQNVKRGAVGWWYHVAPIVKVGRTKYVLDPAINPDKPLPVKEWLSKMGKPEKIKVAICDTGTYSPGDNCQKKTDGLELRAHRTQKHYLMLEEREIKRLGRDPRKLLGENPPWK